MTVSREQSKANLKAPKSKKGQRLARRRQFVVPVTRLPFEVLSNIFTIQVDRGRSPWVLLRVCRLWKAVAASTPRIWRYIRISRCYGEFDSGTSLQNCFTKAHLEKALSRTGAVPLVISIDLCSYFYDEAGDPKCLFGLYDALLKVMNRCDTLELKESLFKYPEDSQLILAGLLFPLPSSVRCLYVGRCEDTGIGRELLVGSNRKCTAPRELSIHVTNDSSLAHSPTDHEILRERVTAFSDYTYEIRADVFEALPDIENFYQLYGCFALPELSSISSLLQEAHFTNASLRLGTQQLGNLRKLVLRYCHLHEQPGAIKLPVLDTLIFENGEWLPILMLDCPSLSRLELVRGPTGAADAEGEVNQIWGPEQQFAHLKALKIDIRMPETVLITILEKLGALELLNITLRRDYPNELALGEMLLNSLLLKNSGRSGIVQNLRTLIIRVSHSSWEYGEFRQRFRTGIRRIVRSRQRSAPLWSATLLVLGFGDFFLMNEEEFVVCEEEE